MSRVSGCLSAAGNAAALTVDRMVPAVRRSMTMTMAERLMEAAD